ncbi:MAG: thiamine pyrophosphate-binding protein [Polyangiales bacterium]
MAESRPTFSPDAEPESREHPVPDFARELVERRTDVRALLGARLDLEPLEPLAPANEPTTEPSSLLAADAAARRLVDALVERGVDTFFGIPGGPACPLFEAIRLVRGARLVASRHESHAAFAAVAFHRATGRVPAVVVTAGPGITNVVTGVATASFERVPMLVLAGDVAWRSSGGRLAQDSGPEGLDAEALLGPITRKQVRIASPRSAVPQTLSALDSATDSFHEGPSLVVVPIDVGMAPAPYLELPPPVRRMIVEPPTESVVRTAHLLANAERPLLVIGAGCRSRVEEVRALVDVLDVPFVTTPRAKGLVSEEHPRSLRNGGMAASAWARRYTAAGVDATLVLGSDLDDSDVGPTPYVAKNGRMVHVDLDADVFARNLPTELAVVADVGAFARALTDYVVDEGLRNGRCRDVLRALRTTSPVDEAEFASDPRTPIAPHRLVADLAHAALPGTRFVTDIGEHMLFALHYLTATGPDDFHIQLRLGSMGSGIAGAVGLALGDPRRPVICLCGDGGMQMSGMEALVAAKEGLPITYAVFNDARYNMVHHGMKQIFGSAAPWDTPRIDFAAWANAMGIPSAVVRRPGEITRELLVGLGADSGPVVLDVRIDRDVRLSGVGRAESLRQMAMADAGQRPGGGAR